MPLSDFFPCRKFASLPLHPYFIGDRRGARPMFDKFLPKQTHASQKG
jgi:hypothetical protein